MIKNVNITTIFINNPGKENEKIKQNLLIIQDDKEFTAVGLKDDIDVDDIISSLETYKNK